MAVEVEVEELEVGFIGAIQEKAFIIRRVELEVGPVDQVAQETMPMALLLGVVLMPALLEALIPQKVQQLLLEDVGEIVIQIKDLVVVQGVVECREAEGVLRVF